MKRKHLLTAAAVGAATVAAGMGAANVHADSVTVTKQHIGDETKVTTTTHHDGKSQSQISSDKAAVASQKQVVSSAKASMDSAQSVVNNDKTKVSSAQANVDSAKSKLDSAQSKVNEPSSLKNDMSKQSQRISSDKTAIANKQNDVKNDQAKVAQDQQHKLTPEQQSKIDADKQAVADAQSKVNQDEQNVKKAEVNNSNGLTTEEQAALNEINHWRAQKGLTPLKVAANLQEYAKQYANSLSQGSPERDWKVVDNAVHAMGYPEKAVIGSSDSSVAWEDVDGKTVADDWYYDKQGFNYDWPKTPHHNMMMVGQFGSIGIAEYDGCWAAVYAVGNPVGLSVVDNPALTAAQNQLKNDQQALQNAQNQLNNDEQTFGVKQLENDQKQLQQDQQDLNSLQNDLQNAQNQLDNDQKTLNSITPVDIANAKKALADAQNDYNNAVQALNQAQAQENTDQATLAKYQMAYQAALQKLDELEAALKADEPYDTTSVQWIKDQQPMTSAEISSRYVMRSTAKASSYTTGNADVVYADTVMANKQTTKKALPDTGDAQNSAASMAGILGLGLAGILSMFGLAERKKRN